MLLGNALVSAAFQILLLVIYARAVRGAWRARRGRILGMATTAYSRPIIVLTSVYGCYRICTQVLLLRWVRRVVRRVEDGTEPREKRPSS